MSARFVNIDHDTPLLLPPDLRDWVSPNHMVHFIMDAVKALDLSQARTNQRGTGHAQYPPSMMLGLLIYSYTSGTVPVEGVGKLRFAPRVSIASRLRSRRFQRRFALIRRWSFVTMLGMGRDMEDTCRLYTDLAWLWPMWGDAVDEYAHYGEHVRSLIRQHAMRSVASLLNIGCGGGKNIFNLKRKFDVTGLDLSPAMIAQARELNPDCTIIRGDMRNFRLRETFDAVLMDDAISHMNCRADFVAAFRAAYAHLKPGGVMIVTPDVTTETFQQNKTTTTPVPSGAGRRSGRP